MSTASGSRTPQQDRVCSAQAHLQAVLFRLALGCCQGQNPYQQLECIWGVHRAHFPHLFHLRANLVLYSEPAMLIGEKWETSLESTFLIEMKMLMYAQGACT